jgi:O-antigen biosynthesis protein
MLQRENAAVFLGAWMDACALWRMYMPHLNMPGSDFYVFKAAPRYDLIAMNDVAVVQRMCTKPQYEFLKIVRALGMKVVYDLDDNVWELPEYNPAHRMLTAYRDGFITCIRAVDIVSVSTKTLAKAVRKHVKNMTNYRGKEIPIVVAENRADFRMFAPPRKAERMLVGWAGSSSHVGDLMLVKDAVKELATEHPEVDFEFRGCDLPEDFQGVSNIQHKMWMPVAEFCSRMPVWGWHIALAPVTDHVFNSSKSCIKMVEAAYCKIPCLASWVQPYEEFCSHDPELRWLLCASSGNWKTKLKILLHDEALRNDLGERSYQVALKHYSFDAPHEGWQQVFDTVRAI